MFLVTKEFKFEMSHVLTNYNGPCGNLHGHSYVCLVTFCDDNVNKKTGMVCDFSEIKRLCNDIIFNDLDHCCAINTTSDDDFEIELYELLMKHNKRIYEFPFRTTAENMSKFIFDKINSYFTSNNVPYRCSKVQLYETVTGSATYENK